MNLLGFDHPFAAILLSAYGVVLLLLMVRLEFASGRQPEPFEFTQLLDKLERVRPESGFLVRAPATWVSDHSWRLSEDLEVLRRMSANAAILATLAEVGDGEASPEEMTLARQIRRESIWLRVHVYFLRQFLPHIGYVPGIERLLITQIDLIGLLCTVSTSLIA